MLGGKEQLSNGVASHPGGSGNTPSCFMPQKPEISACLMLAPLGLFADMVSPAFFHHKLCKELDCKY